MAYETQIPTLTESQPITLTNHMAFVRFDTSLSKRLSNNAYTFRSRALFLSIEPQNGTT